MPDLYQDYATVSIKTADELGFIAHSETIPTLSRLSLPEIEAIVKQVAWLVPAGNIPGLVLSGLARLPGRVPPPETVKKDLNVLLQAVEQSLDVAVYAAIFAGPAAVIWAYQNLLTLAGKDLEAAFPDGLWQFYVEYALREDSARHTNETHGFDTFLNEAQLRLNLVDRVTAWVMAAVTCLHQYDALLTNEWRERIYTYLLAKIAGHEPDAARYAGLYTRWEKQRPYGRGPDSSAGESYPAYRRRRFDQFLSQVVADLPDSIRAAWQDRAGQAESEDLPAYVRQMSILAYLDPGPYAETRTPIPLAAANLGLIHQDHYYLIPVCRPGTTQPAEAQTVRATVAAILAGSTRPGMSPPRLAEIRRAAWPALRQKLAPNLVEELNRLRLAPILFNCTPRPAHLPLAELRQTERGWGEHAMTLVDTGSTMTFDQSHIFFDGTWGAALAEIMTQEAIGWARQLQRMDQNPPGSPAPPLALRLEWRSDDLAAVGQAARIAMEVGAETAAVDLNSLLKLRQQFKQRSEQIRLTVNDLLILYRTYHALTYQPPAGLIAELKDLAENASTRPAALAALAVLEPSEPNNPAIAIPVDASPRSPRQRLYAMTFELPGDLDLIGLHQRTRAALASFLAPGVDREQAYVGFDQLRREYLATLGGLGELLNKGKDLARLGESTSTGGLRLLAYLPAPLQRLLNKVPDRFEMLNNLIKGKEVFSNIGAVAPTSSLTRFVAARDDNVKKTLVWGVVTDAQGIMRVTLRDFRPHVGLLVAAGQQELARRIAEHYLESYTAGLNEFIGDLHRITQASRRHLTANGMEQPANDQPSRR